MTILLSFRQSSVSKTFIETKLLFSSNLSMSSNFYQGEKKRLPGCLNLVNPPLLSAGLIPQPEPRHCLRIHRWKIQLRWTSTIRWCQDQGDEMSWRHGRRVMLDSVRSTEIWTIEWCCTCRLAKQNHATGGWSWNMTTPKQGDKDSSMLLHAAAVC